MAQLWAKKEDIIVCNYCLENPWAFSSEVDVENIMALLKSAGFTSRSQKAVRKRARDYELLREENIHPSIPTQVQEVFELINNRPPKEETDLWIERYVCECYCTDSEIDEDVESVLSEPAANMTHLLTIDTPKTEKTFYVVFDELLKEYYKKHMTGKKTLGAVKKEFKNDLIYTYDVSENTFNAIKREKYDTVSRVNLFKLCFALELEYEDAKRLLASVGYDFRRNVKSEVVIEAILKSNSHRRFIVSEIDETLQKYANTRLFS